MRRLLAIGLLLITALSARAESMAVLYLERVFDESALVSARAGELKQIADEVRGVLDSMTTEIKNLETELQIRPPSHARYGEFKEKYEVAKLRYKLYSERQQARLGQKEVELLRQAYEEMRLVIADFAKERGFDMVFLVSEPNFQAPNGQALRLAMAQRAILYHKESLDITKDFIAYANARAATAGDKAETPSTESP